MAKPGRTGRGALKGARRKVVALSGKPPKGDTPKPKIGRPPAAGRPPRLAHLVQGTDRQLKRERALRMSIMRAPAPASPRSANPTPSSDAPPSGLNGDILCLPNPEWLPHELTVTGPVGDLADFQKAAAGSGNIPWIADYDRLEEDWVNAMLTPPPAERGISLEGARILARQLRERVEVADQRAAEGSFGGERCPLDLHRLVPAPARILRLGPDDPAALAWLWENWGTTWALRSVEAIQDDQRTPPVVSPDTPVSLETPDGHGGLRYRFWSADWTPWRALAAVRSRWPSIMLQVSVRAVSE